MGILLGLGAAAGAGGAGIMGIFPALLSGIASLAGAQAQANATKMQARIAEMQARQEALRARAEALAALERQNEVANAAMAAAAASGIDPSQSESVQQNLSSILRKGTFQVATLTNEGRVRQSLRQTEANALRATARAQRTAGMFSLIRAGFTAIGSAINRG